MRADRLRKKNERQLSSDNGIWNILHDGYNVLLPQESTENFLAAAPTIRNK